MWRLGRRIDATSTGERTEAYTSPRLAACCRARAVCVPLQPPSTFLVDAPRSCGLALRLANLKVPVAAVQWKLCHCGDPAAHAFVRDARALPRRLARSVVDERQRPRDSHCVRRHRRHLRARLCYCWCWWWCWCCYTWNTRQDLRAQPRPVLVLVVVLQRAVELQLERVDLAPRGEGSERQAGAEHRKRCGAWASGAGRREDHPPPLLAAEHLGGRRGSRRLRGRLPRARPDAPLIGPLSHPAASQQLSAARARECSGDRARQRKMDPYMDMT